MEDYQRIHHQQRKYMDDDIWKDNRKPIHESWFKEDTADYWRHKRMYETIEPLALYYRDKKWLTIGDGRFGLDSYRLKKLYKIDAFPTDISKNMLEEAKVLGKIKEYGVENAEELSFLDNTFDLAFCKESYHHFPRPNIALYEMIRVAKSAVILIEPNDRHVLNHPKMIFRQLIKMLVNALFPKNKFFSKEYSFFDFYPHSFEQSGNYVFSISRREIEKIVHGANLGGFAWKGINDYYVKGCEFARAHPDNDIFRTMKNRIQKIDAKCIRFPLFYDWSSIAMVVFKKTIDHELKIKMETAGFNFLNVKENPHVS